MGKTKYVTKLGSVSGLTEKEKYELNEVSQRYVFRTNEYYLSLIDWNDPYDPIRRIIIPDTDELETWGNLDASNEKRYTKLPGLEHKYRRTVILLLNNICGGYCRYCFRKRLFMNMNDEIMRDFSRALDYIRKHREIDNVLLSGGDPLVMSTNKLEKIISKLREIEHVKIIRIGTKIPAFDPFRILNDPSLLEMLKRYITFEKKIYLMVHFNHPRELTEQSIKAVNLLQKTGAVTANQTPIISGVNDSPMILGELFNKLSYIGVPPYYEFQCRPTEGNKPYVVPVERACEIHAKAKIRCSGLARRSRFVMSHVLGKIEVIGLTDEHIIFKFHRAANPSDRSRITIFQRNPEAYWYSDYNDLVAHYSVDNTLPLFSQYTVQ